METTYLETEKEWKKSVRMVFSPEEVEQEELKLLGELKKEVAIPGFRKGKVPFRLLRARFQKELKSDIIDSFTKRAFETLFGSEGEEEEGDEGKEKIEPIGTPGIEDVEYEKGGSCSFTVNFTVRPEVKLEKYKGFKVGKKRVEITDEQVDEVLRKLQENNAEFIDAGDRGAILTDLIAIEETLVDADGNPLPGSKTQTQNINLGDSMILKEVNDALVGMKVGEEKVVVIERNPKKPEDGDTEGDDENAAKDDENKVEESAKPEVLYVKYKINEIKERRLPVLNDDFAKDMGEFESLEDLKKKIYEDLTAEEEKRADSEMKESLLEMLIKENPVEVPDPLLEIYSDRLIRREFDRHVGYGGKLENFPYDAVNEGVKDLAEKLAKWDLLKEALIKKESLKLTPEEIEAEIAAIAEKNGVSPSRVKLDLEKQKKKESFEDELQDNKVLDYLISVSEITER